MFVMSEQVSLIVTVVVIGGPGVGKSTLIKALATGTGPGRTAFTSEGVDTRDVEVGGRTVTLRFKEIAGRVRKGCLNNSDVEKADGVILMYDLCTSSSFNVLEDLVDNIKERLRGKSIMLVGNKTYRSRQRDRQVLLQDEERLAQTIGASLCNLDAYDYMEAQEVMQNWTNEILSCKEPPPQQSTGWSRAREVKHNEQQPQRYKPPAQDQVRQRHFKVIVVGNSQVGKTSFITRFTTEEFVEGPHVPTAQDDIRQKEFHVEHHSVILKIWDTAGQERFSTLPRQYYVRAEGAIVMYDITNRQSYLDATKWAKEINEKAQKRPVLVVIGTKYDLSISSEPSRTVTIMEGETLAHKLSSPTMSISYFEASAKTGYGIQAAMKHLAMGYCLVGAWDDGRTEAAVSARCTFKQQE
ncbi:uncharacterized protein LOC135368717 isoform X2 [Ornithodoros turicata]|uniref:uncharacterized protein LOC135368717 isoform X2 n=1 Tax=Ornithodoros turicata TaxID=34597 RepID=UPI0031388E8B